jgi:hypothetical protein
VKQSIVIYHGPSMLDGAPIVALASVGSSNVKTGRMVQTWIMRADMHPSEASARKCDASVCGLCSRRHSLDGDCYVAIVHAPRSVWESWDRQGRPGTNWTDEQSILALQTDARANGLRIGSYGDPMAVPAEVWQDLISALAPRSVVGYTHQWNRAWSFVTTPGSFHRYTMAGYEWFRENVMASCDSVAEAELARSLGWRFFLAIPNETHRAFALGAIQCPATRDSNPLTCDRCGICNGAQGKATRASVFLMEHGVRSVSKGKRSAALAVLS